MGLSFAALLAGVPRYDETTGWRHPEGIAVRLSDVLAALSAAVPDDLAEAVWKPIETAPRGGEWFMARSEHGQTRAVHYADEYDRFPISHDGVVWSTAPVEWMPLSVFPALIATVTAQAARIEGLEAERDAAVTKTKKNAKIAAKAYTIITLAADDLQDDGDRVYLGSTNTADILRDAREEWAAHRITGEDVLTLVEENRVFKARAEAAETALATVTKERDELAERNKENSRLAEDNAQGLREAETALAAERAKVERLVWEAAEILEQIDKSDGMPISTIGLHAAITEAGQ